MDSLEIKGGTPLHGEVEISGAKNAVLPILAATLLTREPCVIRRVPDLEDVRTMCLILESLGATTKIEKDVVTVQAAKVGEFADYDLVRKMRGSISPSAFSDTTLPLPSAWRRNSSSTASQSRMWSASCG